MKKSLYTVVLSCILMLVSLYTVTPAAVFACSCAEPPTVAESLERKTAIFAGKVTKLINPRQKLVMSSADPVKVWFEVTEVWKGGVAKNTEISTAMSSESCGYDQFVVGQAFLVFAYDGQGHLETGLCEGTKLLSSAGKELTELGAGYPPTEGSTSSGGKPASPFANSVLWGIAGIVLLFAILLFFWIKRKRNVKGM